MEKVDKRKLRIECLVQIQSFETFWAYYSQSGGKLYEKECREMAIRFIKTLETLSKIDPKILNPEELNLGKKTDLDEIIQPLRNWGKSAEATPYEKFHHISSGDDFY